MKVSRFTSLQRQVDASQCGALRHVSNGEHQAWLRSASVVYQRMNTVQDSEFVAVKPTHVVEAQHQQHEIRGIGGNDIMDKAFTDSRRAAPDGKMVTVKAYASRITTACAQGSIGWWRTSVQWRVSRRMRHGCILRSDIWSNEVDCDAL